MNNLEFTAAVSVDKGKIRNNNEDNFYLNGKNLIRMNREESKTYENKADSSEIIHIYGVFDGMGGEEAGEEASIIAAETLKKIHNSIINSKEKYDVKKLINKSVEIANNEICNKMLEENISRMGTTFSAITIDEGRVIAYNLGDSRIYMMRNGNLEQISVDDTVVQRMVDSGIITKEEARFHKERHVITQHLGIFPDELKLEINISNEISYKKGDCFLICSDGLTDMVTDDAICRILSQKKSCKKLSQELVQEALNNGGKDNVTAMVIISERDSKEKNTNDTCLQNNNNILKRNKLLANKKNLIVGVAALVFLCGTIAITTNHIIQKGANEKENIITNLEWSIGDNLLDDVIYKDAEEINGDYYCKIGFNIEKQTEDFRCNVTYESSNPEIIEIDSITGKVSINDVGVATLTATVSEKESIEKEVVVFDIDMKTKKLNMTISDTTGIEYNIILPENCPEKISEENIRQNSEYYISDEDSNCICINEDKTITACEYGSTELLVFISGYETQIPVNVTNINIVRKRNLKRY